PGVTPGTPPVPTPAGVPPGPSGSSGAAPVPVGRVSDIVDIGTLALPPRSAIAIVGPPGSARTTLSAPLTTPLASTSEKCTRTGLGVGRGAVVTVATPGRFEIEFVSMFGLLGPL